MCHEYGFLNHFLASAKTDKNLKEAVDSLLLEVSDKYDTINTLARNFEHEKFSKITFIYTF